VGSNPARDMDIRLLSMLCCPVLGRDLAKGRYPVQGALPQCLNPYNFILNINWR